MYNFRNIVIILGLSLSSFSYAQAPSNGTFPTIIRIANRTANSTERIANTLDYAQPYLPLIYNESKRIANTLERCRDLFEEISSISYLAKQASVFVAVSLAVGLPIYGGYRLIRYWVDTRCFHPPEVSEQTVD